MVGESGIFVPEDVAYVQEVSRICIHDASLYEGILVEPQLADGKPFLQAGVGAILVGESLVKQGDPAAGIKQLLQL